MINESITADNRDYAIRSATRADVPTIVALLADDVLGSQREAVEADLAPYHTAFERIAAHPNQKLLVVERQGTVVGTLDIATLASLSRQGTLRMQVEAVRVARTERGTGLGSAIFTWLIDHAIAEGCGILQLTTDRSREDAHRFYERLGFTPSHIGYKLDLGTRS